MEYPSRACRWLNSHSSSISLIIGSSPDKAGEYHSRHPRRLSATRSSQLATLEARRMSRPFLPPNGYHLRGRLAGHDAIELARPRVERQALLRQSVEAIVDGGRARP